MATGVRTRHARSCKSRDGGGCNCTPTYQAQAYDARTGRQVWRTFPTRSAAKLWRQDAQVALRRGTMRPPTAKTIAEAAEVLIAGAHDGTILDRGGKPYKPSTARGYEQLLRSYVVPALGGWKLSQVQRRDVQDFVDDLRKQRLSASTIANILDPLRVIFRRAMRRDEISIDPTDNLDLPAIRGRRDRIEPPERAHEYLAALPDSERAFWAVALFCGLRRGELRGLQWINVDFEAGVIRVERSWDPVKGPVDVKTGAGRRAVPMAFVVRRELMAHKARTGRDGRDLVFGRTATEVVLRVDDQGPREQGMEASRTRADHPARSASLRDLVLHRRRPGLEADLHLGRPRRCPPDLEPLRAPRAGRRRPGPGAPRCIPHAQPTNPDCGAHCGARPQQRRNPRQHGGSEVPLPGFEMRRRPMATGENPIDTGF